MLPSKLCGCAHKFTRNWYQLEGRFTLNYLTLISFTWRAKTRPLINTWCFLRLCLSWQRDKEKRKKHSIPDIFWMMLTAAMVNWTCIVHSFFTDCCFDEHFISIRFQIKHRLTNCFTTIIMDIILFPILIYQFLISNFPFHSIPFLLD